MVACQIEAHVTLLVILLFTPYLLRTQHHRTIPLSWRKLPNAESNTRPCLSKLGKFIWPLQPASTRPTSIIDEARQAGNSSGCERAVRSTCLYFNFSESIFIYLLINKKEEKRHKKNWRLSTSACKSVPGSRHNVQLDK